MCRSVDLPEPLGPMMETNSPFSIENVTPRRAKVGVSSSVYSFFRSRRSIIVSLRFETNVDHLLAGGHAREYLDVAIFILDAERYRHIDDLSILQRFHKCAAVVLQYRVLRKNECVLILLRLYVYVGSEPAFELCARCVERNFCQIGNDAARIRLSGSDVEDRAAE